MSDTPVLTNLVRYRMETRIVRAAPDDSEPYYADLDPAEALNGEWVKWEDVKPLLAAVEPSGKPDAEFLSLVGHCSNCSCEDCLEFFRSHQNRGGE